MIAFLIAQIVIINSYSVGPAAIVAPDPGNILQEDGSKLLQQDGTSKLVKQFAVWVQGNLLQQDGTSKIMQQDGTSILKTQ